MRYLIKHIIKNVSNRHIEDISKLIFILKTLDKKEEPNPKECAHHNKTTIF